MPDSDSPNTNQQVGNDEQNGKVQSQQTPKPAKSKDKQARRASVRVSCDWPVTVITEQKKKLVGRTCNISSGGVQIQIKHNFPKGTNLYMDIDAYSNGKKQKIEVVGEVVYSIITGSYYKLGLKFVTSVEQFEAFLKRFCN